jgi:hypothetical protein
LNGTEYKTTPRIIEHQERETCNKLVSELNRIVSTELLPELYTDIETQLLNIKKKINAAKPSIPIKKAIYCIDATEVLTKNHPNPDEPLHSDSNLPSELWIIGTPSAVKELDADIVKISNVLNVTADDEEDNSHLDYSLVKTETEELTTIRYIATRRLIRDFITLMLNSEPLIEYRIDLSKLVVTKSNTELLELAGTKLSLKQYSPIQVPWGETVNVAIEMSGPICQILGSKAVDCLLTHLSKPVSLPPQIQLVHSLIIYTDIIEEQYFGGDKLQVLHTHRLTEQSNVMLESPHYLNVNKSNISSINIRIHDREGNLVKFTDKYAHVEVKLHFKKR